LLDKCFNCGEEIDDELDTYAVLVGMSGRINFCESCGKTFNIPNWYNKKELIHMSKQYVIYNFLNFFYEGDYDNSMPSLTPLHEDAIIFNLHDAKTMLDKLHKLGFTGLQMKEYVKGLYDWEDVKYINV